LLNSDQSLTLSLISPIGYRGFFECSSWRTVVIWKQGIFECYRKTKKIEKGLGIALCVAYEERAESLVKGWTLCCI